MRSPARSAKPRNPRMKTKQRIGVFGGVFDPPHIGHLIIALYVLEEQKLDRILFIPAGQPPHKHRFSPFEKRYEMTRIAIKRNPFFLISAVEKKMAGKTYTIEVIRTLRKKIKGSLFLIIGSDQWQEIDTWKDPAALFRECTIIVVPRSGFAIRRKKGIPGPVIMSGAPRIDISSTMIRERINQGKSVRYLVPAAVGRYIRRNKLYQSPG